MMSVPALAPATEVCPHCQGEKGHYVHLHLTGFDSRPKWKECVRCGGVGTLQVPGIEPVESGLSAFTIDVVERIMRTHRTAAPVTVARRRERLIDLLDAAHGFAETVDDESLSPSTRRAAVREVVRAAEEWMKAKRIKTKAGVGDAA